jgi:hypothetical protein
MKVIIDAEFDSLAPTKIWCIVCKDVDTEKRYVFRFDKQGWQASFRDFAKDVSCWIGVNNLVFDGPNINYLMGGLADVMNSYKQLDLLIVSRLVWYARPKGHSVRAWGDRFGMNKPEVKIYDDPKLIDMYVDRCEHDVEIQFRVYKELLRFIEDPQWQTAIKVEHEVQRICMEMKENGFSFDYPRAQELIAEIEGEMEELEKLMLETIPLVLQREGDVTLKRKKDGSPNKNTSGYIGNDTNFVGDSIWCRFEYAPFNPGSAKQRIELLNRSGWRPTDKTKGHLQCERALQRAKRFRLPKGDLEEKLERYKIYGWKRPRRIASPCHLAQS